ncbi:MAG: hypothetical protein EOO89_04100, partial [Pedobacter sp.]
MYTDTFCRICILQLQNPTETQLNPLTMRKIFTQLFLPLLLLTNIALQAQVKTINGKVTAAEDGISLPVDDVTANDPRIESSAQYAGGDFQGVMQKLPYLAKLGVNALWLSAPYDNRDKAGPAWNTSVDPNLYSAYHGYWPAPEYIDYTNPLKPNPTPKVEPRYGTADDLKSLVDTAHQTTANLQKMKVLFDYVMKHVDSESGLYKRKPEWFVTPNGTARVCADGNLWNDVYWGTRCSFKEYLPSFDFYKEEPVEWSIADALWWAREFKADGFRIDAVKHVPLSWVESLRKKIDLEIGGKDFYT